MNYTTISFGHWSGLLSLLFLIITVITSPKMIGIATIVYVLLMGNLLHFLGIISEQLFFRSFSFLALLIGYLLYGVGIAIYLSVGLGAGPMDGVMFAPINQTRLTIRSARISLDFLLTFIGFLLGGKLGIGTILGIFCMGPIINFFLPFFEKRILGSRKIQMTKNGRKP